MSKDHYVSQFHLRQFLDPASDGQRDRWLWQGLIDQGRVKRRAPKNFGYKASMFAGAGALGNPGETIETFLAENVEAPAAPAIREFCDRPSGSGGDLPPPLMRYLVWAAARSLPMKALSTAWAMQQSQISDIQLVEGPPPALLAEGLPNPAFAMVHPQLGKSTFPPDSDRDQLARDGWIIDFDDSYNLLQSIHIQAYYFQVRWFPRLKWHTLHAPKQQYFVISDRCVGWAADGFIDAPPSCLRDPSAYVLAPLSKDLVLVGRHTTDAWSVSPGQINTIIACWGNEWIAGPTRQVVEDALSARRFSIR